MSSEIDKFLSKKTQQVAPIAIKITLRELGRDWVPCVLSIIQHESGGQIGIGSKVGLPKARHKMIPSKSGAQMLIDRAFGLMQVIPSNVIWWAESNKTTAYFDDLTGTTLEAAEIQIEQGVFILKKTWATIKKYFPVVDKNAMAFCLMAYAIGQKPVIELIEKIKNQKLPLTFENAKKIDPNLGKPHNNPIGYATYILNRFDAVKNWVESTAKNDTVMMGIEVFGVAIAIWLLLNRI